MRRALKCSEATPVISSGGGQLRPAAGKALDRRVVLFAGIGPPLEANEAMRQVRT